MNIGMDFNNFNIKASAKNFIQVFLIGWIGLSCLLFVWSATSDYGLQKTLNDTSIELFISPVFWLIPFLVALVVGFTRGVTHMDVDVTDPKQLELYFNRQKLSNQPLWFKTMLVGIVILFIYLSMRPESEITVAQYQQIHKQLTSVKSKELTSIYDNIMIDGRIMKGEYRTFMNSSLKIQFGSLE